MTDHDDTLGGLSEELVLAIAAGEDVDVAIWAARFGVDTADVVACRRALQALDLCLGEDVEEGHPELPRPTLPADYEIDREIGRGGMGVVYRAVQRGLGRAVAVKVLRPGDLQFGDAMQRFRAEARSLARLRHCHIVSVHDVGETPEGLVWYAMDLVEGRTLADEIAERGRLMPSRALKILRQVTSAIAHAHSQGVVHRDLKPQNVLIDENGDAFVVDFGLARDAAAAGTRTMTGELLGTPAYMSPEQARGDRGRIGEATDVWALGALLYECVAGFGPFAGKPLHETIRAILHDDPVPPRKVDPRVPPGIDAICLKALRKRSAQRYATALALGEDLDRFAAGRPVLARPPSRWERVGRFARRNKKPLLAAAAAAVVAVAGFAVFVLPGMQRAAAIAEARRVLDAGYPGAAIETFRELAAGLASGDPVHHEIDLDFARALNDRAGELLAQGDEAAARELAAQARALGELRQQASRPEDAFWVEGSSRDAWRWELTRAYAMSADSENSLGGGWWGIGIDPVRLADALASERDALRYPALRVTRIFREDPALAELDEPLRTRVLLDLHRWLGELIANGEARERSGPVTLTFPFRWQAEQIAAWWSPSNEDALADLAVDSSASDAVRALAYRSWAIWTGLPAFESVWTPPPPIDGKLSAAAAAAPDVVAAWRRWRTLPREEALAARLEFLVGALERDVFGLGELRDWRITQVLQVWLGLPRDHGAQEAALTRWRRQIRGRAAETWVRELLDLPDDETVSLERALERAAVEPVGPAMLWRHLAWLRLPDGVRVPEAVPDQVMNAWPWIDAWWAAAAIDRPRGYVARIAVLSFENAATEPVLVGECAAPLAIGEAVPLEVRGRVSVPRVVEIDGRELGEDERLAAYRREHPGALALGEVVAGIDARLTTGEHGPVLRWGARSRLDARLPSRVSSRGGIGPDMVEIGRARAPELDSVGGGRSDDMLDLLLIVRVDRADAAPEDGSLEAWRAAVVRSLEYAAADGHSRAALADQLTPWLWPMPDARAALQRLVGSYGFKTSGAALLAGADLDSGSLLRAPSTGHLPSPALLVRLACAAPDPAVRSRALEWLASDPEAALSPGLADTVLAAAAAGDVTLEAAFAERVRDIAAGRSNPWLSAGVAVAALVVLVAVVGLALAFARPPLGPAAGWFAWTAANVLVFVRISIDGAVVLPQPVAFAAAAVAALRVSTARETRVARYLAAAVYAGFAVWLSFAGFGLVAPPGSLGQGFWIASICAVWILLARACLAARR